MASTLNSVITNSGVEQAILAQAEQGFFIRISSFGISETAGVLDVTRTTPNLEWFKALISSAVKVDQNTVQINCNIPPEAIDDITGLPVAGVKDAAEIYIYAYDQNDVEYLFAIGQPEFTELYSVAASLTLRISIKLINTAVDNIYQFLYTQAQEINDHNNDPNAHPHIQDNLEKFGIYDQQLERVYNGQLIDNFPATENVNDLDAVYLDTIDGIYKQAIFDGSDKEVAIGVYSAAKGTVVVNGIIDYTHTHDPYTNLYLSPSVLGEFGESATDILIGYAMPNNKIMVTPQDIRKRVGADGGGSASFEASQNNHGLELLDGIYFDGANVDPLERKWKSAKADSEFTLATHLVTGFSETLPNVFTATKFGRDIYTNPISKAVGEYYYLSPFYGTDFEVNSIAPVAVTVSGYAAITLQGATIDDRAAYLATKLQELNANFRAVSIGGLVHFEADSALFIVVTDPSIITLSHDTTRAGYATSIAPTEGYDNPLFYVESRTAIHTMMHRPTGIGGAGQSPSGIGEIEKWPAGSSPVGLLPCDGAAVSRTGYAQLFEVIGTTHGVGDGSTTFNVPDITTETGISGNYDYFIRHTMRATYESDLTFHRKNPVFPFGEEGASAGTAFVDSEKYTFFKTLVGTNTNMNVQRLRPGRNFSLAVKSQAAATVSLVITPETEYQGITDITIMGIPTEGGISNPVGGTSTYTVQFAPSEDKKVDIECHSFGGVMYVYIKTSDSWSE
jgi:hypothetical protein